MVVFPVPFHGVGVVGDRGGGAVHEVHESISLSPLLRRSTVAFCVVLGIVPGNCLRVRGDRAA